MSKIQRYDVLAYDVMDGQECSPYAEEAKSEDGHWMEAEIGIELEEEVTRLEEENRVLVMEVEEAKDRAKDLEIQFQCLEEQNTELVITNKQLMEKILIIGGIMDTMVEQLGEAQKENEFLSLAQKNKLTNRQAEVLRSLKAGMTVEEIAEAMGIKKGSVVWHKNKLFRKLGVGTTGEAVTMVAEKEM